MKTVDLSLISLGNLKHFLYRDFRLSDPSNLFTICLNGIEFSIPTEIAICYSTLITQILEVESTLNRIDINIKFNNKNNTQKIIEVLKDRYLTNEKIEINSKEDIFDLGLFGKEFGCEYFLAPLKEYLLTEENNINTENVFQLLDYADQFNNYPLIEKLLAFITTNFYAFSTKPDFLDWCCNDKNTERVESIISSKNLRLDDENQLLDFLLKLCTIKPYFEFLFEYVYIEYCNIPSCKEFLEYLSTKKVEFQSNSMKNILHCMGRRLCQTQLPLSLMKNGKRYTDKYLRFVIGSNTGAPIPEKYIQKIHDYSYKFLYPSESSTTCDNIFKITLKQGNYKVECVGASGGKGMTKHGGFGGYSCGVLPVMQKAELYLYIGGKGTTVSGTQSIYSLGGFNGGGRGKTGSECLNAGSGGGATDIRLNSENLEDRIIVAGGGGGSAGFSKDGRESLGGNGGGLIGESGTTCGGFVGTGGSQEEPGICCNNGDGESGNNNVGGDGNSRGSSGGGGGGGYFGGGGGEIAGGGGGSGYLSEYLQSLCGITRETKQYNHMGNGYVIISLIE